MADLTTTVTPEAVATAAGLGGDKVARGTAARDEALGRLNEALATRFRDPHQAVFDGMVLTVATAVATRNRAPGNGQTASVEDGAAVRPARDVLAGVRGDLARYTVGLA